VEDGRLGFDRGASRLSWLFLVVATAAHFDDVGVEI
jgi:hypothetical protein